MNRPPWFWAVAVLSLLLVSIVLNVPVAVSSTVAGALCTEPGTVAVDDVRITYDRRTMVGTEAVVIRGTDVLYVDETGEQRTPQFRAGEVSRTRVQRLMRTVSRTGVFCLAGEYSDRFVIELSEPVYEDLTIRVQNDSRAISITSGGGDGGPARIRTVISEVRTIGRERSAVGRAEFCRRAATTGSEVRDRYCDTVDDAPMHTVPR